MSLLVVGTFSSKIGMHVSVQSVGILHNAHSTDHRRVVGGTGLDFVQAGSRLCKDELGVVLGHVGGFFRSGYPTPVSRETMPAVNKVQLEALLERFHYTA